MDFAFDALWHGAWVCGLRLSPWLIWWHAGIVALAARGLVYIVSHPGYGMMWHGLLCILVRLPPVRHERAVANADADLPATAVKNTVEEGCEPLATPAPCQHPL